MAFVLRAPAQIRHGLARWAPPVFCALLLGWTALILLPHPERGDFALCYRLAAGRMVQGEPIHRPGEVFGYSYPPFMALLTTPVASWSPRAAQFAFWAMNLLATAATAALSWRLVGGDAPWRLARGWLAVFWLSAVLMLSYFTSPLQHRQFDMLIAALLMAGVWTLVQARPRLTGVVWGLAAAMKCTPLLLGPYLLWRRQWLAALLMGAIALAVNLAPDAIYPQQNGHSYLLDWRQSYLGHVARAAPGQWFADMLHNQSWAGAANRYWRVGRHGRADYEVLRLPLEPDDVRAIRLLTLGGATVFSAVALVAFGRTRGWHGEPATESSPDAAQQERRRLALLAEVALLFSLMLLLSPMSSKAHFVVLLPGVMLLARLAVLERRGWARLALVALFLTGFGCSRDVIGKAANQQAMIFGLPMSFAVVSLLGSAGAMAATKLRDDENRDAAPREEGRATRRQPARNQAARQAAA